MKRFNSVEDSVENSQFVLCTKIANDLHEHQSRWNNEPYILHPMRISVQMSSNIGRCCAIMHDVLEDCHLKLGSSYLNSLGIDNRIVEILKLLTKNKNEPYYEYIERVKTNEIAVKVKILDLRDNLNIFSLLSNLDMQYINDKHRDRINKYLFHLHDLESIILTPGI